MSEANQTITTAACVQRWTDPKSRPLFKGSLIDPDGCCCAQGDVLRVCGWSDDRLRSLEQYKADAEVAKLLGISRFHSVLLRCENDRTEGAPQSVFTADGLAKILGPNWRTVLAFGRHIDTLGADEWDKVAAAWAAAWDAARDAAGSAAGSAARDAAGAAAGAAARDAAGAAAGAAARAAARDAAGDAAGDAARECVGISHLASPLFLKMFFGDGTAAWIEANRNYVDPAVIGGAL